ncbi:MAG: ABC transporter ATP-binding protein [Candidatus Firestonebacteria bacterium]
MIQTIGLTKKFGKVVAVDHLDLCVESGEMFGFLGPNGAGKTTTIKMLTGLLIPNEGKVLIDGYDIQIDPIAAKKIIGFIPDRPFVYEKLTGREFLNFIAGMYGINNKATSLRIEEFLELFELKDWGDELIEAYSHGMKQKVVMIASLLHNPKVLIIDEPMVGLDPKSARLVKSIFQNLAKSGITLFVSTHSLELVEKLCNRIGIIQNGKLIALGTMEELRMLSKTTEKDLEDIFLKLTGATDLTEIIKVI